MNMDNQRSPLLGVSFAYYSCQGKSVEEELRSSLWYTKVELEQTRLTVQEELRKKEEQMSQLRDLLNKAIRERDEANEKCQSLILDKLLLQQQQQQQQQNQTTTTTTVGPMMSGISSIEDEPPIRRGNSSNNGFSSSECEESIVSSPTIQQHHQQQNIELFVCENNNNNINNNNKPLPEKGRLLQAVMKAGPLLQTLLLAGPLPEWRHPPPPLESFQIPPVSIVPSPPHLLLRQDSSSFNNIRFNKKRPFCDQQEEELEGTSHSHSPTTTEPIKYQRLALH